MKNKQHKRGVDKDRTRLVEIRAAEGGADAKALVELQADVYARYCELERL